MKKIFFPLTVLALVISSSSCGNKPEQDNGDKIADHYMDSFKRADSLAQHGTPVDIQFAQAMEKENDEKRVSVTGYLALPHTSYSTGSTGQLGFIGRPNQMDSPLNYILSIPIGTGKNSMKALPDKYTNDDVIVTGKNGEKIHVGDRVKITGKLHASDSYPSMDVQEFEKLDDVAIDYSTLTATKIAGPEKPGTDLDGKLVYAEGTLEMPMLSMSGELTFLYLHVAGLKDQMTVNIAYGNGPGKLEPLPEHYGENDVKIRNSKGELINMKKKVRVYGIWRNERINIECVENI
jgi:hypothetical protein